MSKVHEDNAGYVGVSYEETQDPYFSYNKLSLPLAESDKTVIRDEETITVTQANSKFVIDGTSQKAVSLAEGGVFTFDQSDSSNTGHPLRFSEYEDGTHGADKFGIFNGTDARYLREGSGNLLSNNQSVTVEGHIKPNTNVIRGFFDGGSGTGSVIRNYGGNTFSKQAQEGSGATIPTSEVKVGEWQHLAVTFRAGANDALQIWVFIDGVRVATGGLTGGYTGGPTFDIGTINQGGDGKFDGLIRNFRVTFGTLYPYNFTAPVYTSDLTSTAAGFEIPRVWGQLNTIAYNDAFAQVNPRQIPFTLPSNYDCLDFQCIPNGSSTADFTIEFGSTGASYDAYYLDTSNNWQSIGSFTSGANTSQTFTPGATFKAIRLYSTTGDLGQVVIENAYYETGTASARLLTMVTSLTDTSGSGRGLTNNDVVLGPIEYTTGVTATGTPGQAGAQTKIVVPFGAPDLYYYCSVHSGMGSSAVTPANRFMFDAALPILKTTDAFGETLGTGNNEDPYAANLVLAITGNGSFQDVSATIKGTGTNKAVTAAGNAQLSSSEGRYYGGGSLQLDGTGDYFYLSNSSDFAFGTGDYTVEFWIKTTDTAFNIIEQGSTGGWSTVVVNNNAPLFWQSSRANTNLYAIDTFNDLIDGNWHHIAFVRKGGVHKPYLDGKQIGNASGYTDNTDYTLTSGSIVIGSGANGELNGYLQDIRIYKGVAKYTSNFDLPDQIDLNDRSGNDNNPRNAGASWQTSVSKFYGGAADFDGSGGHLVIPNDASLQFGTGDFTIEGWFYSHSSPSTYPTLISKFDNSDISWIVRLTNTNQIIWYDGNNTASAANVFSYNSWNHFAAVRSAGTVVMYLNGSPVLSRADSVNYDDTNKIHIARQDQNNTANWFDGSIQDIRIYKGIAKYTSSFSPPERSVQGTARRYPSGIYVVS